MSAQTMPLFLAVCECGQSVRYIHERPEPHDHWHHIESKEATPWKK